MTDAAKKPQEPDEMPLFTKTYDFLGWLAPMTNHFPKAQRHTVTRHLLDAALGFLERLTEANNLRDQARLRQLDLASANLDTVRIYLRLAHYWQWLSMDQYKHVGGMVAELGRLLGGWQRGTRQQMARGRGTSESGAAAPQP